MATSGAQEIKKQEALVTFSIISYKTRLRVFEHGEDRSFRNGHSMLLVKTKLKIR